ncbi:MAG: hypothetical protein RIS64_2769 [Bacteroidota bacterium]|jgi:hypothetical protein
MNYNFIHCEIFLYVNSILKSMLFLRFEKNFFNKIQILTISGINGEASPPPLMISRTIVELI